MEPVPNDNGHQDYDIIRWFEEVAENASFVQTQTLRRIIELNFNTEYLKRWLGNIKIQDMESKDLESLYTTLVPLASHADLESYIQRIADGGSSPILTQEPITKLSLSSGTTEGRQKYLPFTSHSAQTTLQIFRLSAAYRSRVYPIRPRRRILEFIYSSKQFKSKGGLTAATATTHYYASEEFKIKQKQTNSFTCSPKEVISGGDYKQATYCHLLLGLIYFDQVEFITSTFAYSLVHAFTTFEEIWKDICNDIKEGTLNPRITSSSMRNAVLELLLPNPSLASTIEKKCKELEAFQWFSVIPKLWPSAKYVYSIMTGTMLPYLKKLRHYSGDLPIVSADYGSTESWIGVNIDPSFPPENITFAVIPTFSYFEFIPLYRQNPRSTSVIDDFIEAEPVPLSQVTVGQEYEVVLTTFTDIPNARLGKAVKTVWAQVCPDGSRSHFQLRSGLYRYRLGDVVEVAGFYKETPKLNFICRRKLILCINIDKNTEKDLQLVVERGSQLLRQTRAELVDFTSHADISDQPGHYIIYWEIKGEVDEDVLEQCCTEMDTSFVDYGYVTSRRTNSIGPLELCIVERGTFRKMLDLFVGGGASLSQFKAPRCTSNPTLLKILNVSAIKRFHSTAYE